MFIPKNHEKLQTISEVFQEEMERHAAGGGVYYDETSAQIAGHAIQTLMPGLAAMQKERVVVEAVSGIVLSDEGQDVYNGVHVEAQLERVSILQQLSRIAIEDFSDQLTTYDLFAVLRPRYVDPEPQDIVFGAEVVVPFSAISHFEAA